MSSLYEIFGQFVISNVHAPPDTPVLYHKRESLEGQEFIGLATQRDLDEAKAQIKAWALEIIGADEHSEYGSDDDTDFCMYRNELRAELRAKVEAL